MEDFYHRLARIRADIVLGMDCRVEIGQDGAHGRHYYQIKCWRKDVVTGEMGYGYGGKAYLSPHATDSELVQTIFGLYKAYWEHEARENFWWRGRQVFGPHMDVAAVWEVAERTDARSAAHVEDRERVS